MSRWLLASFGSALLLGAASVPLMGAAEAAQYRAAEAEAVRFAARMGVVHGGCANEACSGLRGGKPINYFCTPSGCVFDGPVSP